MKNFSIIFLSVVVVLLIIGNFQYETRQVFSGVSVGSQYQSTTTPTVADQVNLCPARAGMASSTTGILGSVNVVKSGAGELTIYDATTTNASLRNNVATSSLILVDFGTSPTAGSYQLDIEFERGLLIDYTTTGTGVSSTTISYRCEG